MVRDITMNRRMFGAGLAALGTVPLLAGRARAAAYPDKNITYIVAAGVGGGSDILARTVARVIGDKKLLPVTMLVENRPGGSGAIGYNYLNSHGGNPYFLGGVGVSFFTTPLLGKMRYNYTSFTPLGALARSPYILVVNANSDIKSLEDLKKLDGPRVGSVGAVADEALLSHLLNKEAGTKIRVVPYDGGGEVIAAVLGGHLELMWGNPNEMLEQVRAGTMRPLAVSAPDRIKELPDVPTFVEQGYDISHTQLRAIVMPSEVPADAVTYWEGILKTVAESDEWREAYLDRFNEIPLFLDSAGLAAEMEATSKRYETLMRELELIK